MSRGDVCPRCGWTDLGDPMWAEDHLILVDFQAETELLEPQLEVLPQAAANTVMLRYTATERLAWCSKLPWPPTDAGDGPVETDSPRAR